MPVLQHFTFIKAFKLFVFFLFLPWIIFPLIFILFLVILLLPFIFAFGSAYICYKIIFRCTIRILPFVFSDYKSRHENSDENSAFIKQESVELDGLELPSPDASDDEEEIRRKQDHKEIGENHEHELGEHQEHILGEHEDRKLKLCRINSEIKEMEESEKKGGEDDEKFRGLKLCRFKAEKKEMEIEKKGGEDDEKFRGLKLCRIKAEKTEIKPFQEKISFWRRIESGDVRMSFKFRSY